MKLNLDRDNQNTLDYLTANGAALDLMHFQTQVMLEFLIGDDREDAFNEYFNQRVATLLAAAKQSVNLAILSQKNGKH